MDHGVSNNSEEKRVVAAGVFFRAEIGYAKTGEESW
jgi:hypothetical protein